MKICVILERHFSNILNGRAAKGNKKRETLAYFHFYFNLFVYAMVSFREN